MFDCVSEVSSGVPDVTDVLVSLSFSVVNDEGSFGFGL